MWIEQLRSSAALVVAVSRDRCRAAVSCRAIAINVVVLSVTPW